MDKRICYIGFIVFILCFMVGCTYNIKANGEGVLEEVNPIRENNKIEGVNYKIVLKNNDIDYFDSKIIQSIEHYTDIVSLDDVYVNIKFINESSSVYRLKKINLIVKGEVIKSYNYDKKIMDNSTIKILFDKETICKIGNEINDATIRIFFKKGNVY